MDGKIRLKESADPARKLLGAAALAAGAVLCAFALAGQVPAISGRLPLVPFFDRLLKPGHWLLLVTQAAAAALLAQSGWALRKAKSWSGWMFIGAGWGGLLFTLAALLPRRRLLGMAEFGRKALINKGQLPEEASLLDLVMTQVPGWALAGTGLFLAVWIGLLVYGTVCFWPRASAGK